MAVAHLLVIALLLSGSLPPPSARAETGAAQLDIAEVQQTIERANSDAVYGEAFRTTSVEPLRTAWACVALLDLAADLDALRALNQYLDLQLEGLEFARIAELGPMRVRAVTAERWLARLHTRGGAYLGYQRQPVENRYLLEQRADTWYVVEVH